MIDIIYKIPTANDGDHHKYNNDNTIKHLESNKYNILDLAEKHYENLVEALTNNAIASSNPKPALPPSSSIFLNRSAHSDIYRIEEPEYFHHTKGHIAD